MRFSLRSVVSVLRTRGVMWLMSLSLLCAASVAQAQSSQGQFDRGVAALNAARYTDAVALLGAAYQQDKAPLALYHLGVAYNGLSQPSKALEAFQAYVSYADPDKESTTITAVKAEIARIESTVARFAVKVSPADAAIKVDGYAAVIKDNEIWLLPGTHAIDIRAAGYEPYTQPIEVQTGRYTLEINLRTPTLPPASQAAVLVDEGMALSAQGDNKGAMAKFLEAHALSPTPRGTAQMGLTQEALGDLGAAEWHINESLKGRKDPWIRKNRALLRKALQRVMKQTRTLARLDVSGPYPGAKIIVNDREMGTLPLVAPLRLESGSFVLLAKLEGYMDFVFEGDVPKRGTRKIIVQMEIAPPPPVIPPPLPAPEPVAVAPEPPPVEPEPAPAPVATAEPEEKLEGPSQADIEAALREQGNLPDEYPAAQGFEMGLNLGYLAWLDDGPGGSSGGPYAQLSLGFRIPWFLSFGIELINLGADFGAENTQAVVFANPGFYVRGHTQRDRKPYTFDIWGGVGFQPLAMGLTFYEAGAVDPTRIAQAGGGANAIATQAAMSETGIGDVVSLQTMNVPLELGATFFVTAGIGINLSLALTFWMPQQVCYHDKDDNFCFDRGLETTKSFFVGGGLSFLP